MFYFVTTPWWLKKLYRTCLWDMPGDENIIYLTFDDGPHPKITAFVLDELKKYGAKATFFCIGKNVIEYSTVYKRIIEEGHKVGNHTHNHVNGWKIGDKEYLDNIYTAKKYIDSDIFRPPYGRIKRFQLKQLSAQRFKLKTIMWSVLSGDFDPKLSPESCLKNVLKNAKQGSIIVFHDSEKAFEKLSYSLPKVLEYFSKKGFAFKAIAV